MANKILTPLSNMETASFCSQMAMILKSGISSLEGISIMLEEAKDSEEKELLSVIYETLIKTGSLHEALSSAGVYPAYLLSMVEIGEQTGKLDEVMHSLADYYEKEANLAQTIKNAVTYPFIMIVMMVLVIFVLVTKVMPVFNQVFRQLGTEMSGLSKVILDAGAFMNRYSVVFLAAFALIIGVLIYLLKTRKGLGLKSTKALADKIAAYRFANGMALTLSSGLTPETCLNLTAGLIEDEQFAGKLSDCQKAVAGGEDLCTSLLSCGIFSGIYARMASIGSKTGVLDDVMRKIAAQYEEDIDTRIAGVIATIEPSLVIILSVIVGIILLSVMLPLMGIMSGL